MATDAKTGQPIFHGATRVGLRNVGSYQVSGHPFVTGSVLSIGHEAKVSFPYVTKNITVINSSSANGTTSDVVRVHFASTGSNEHIIPKKHYIQLNSYEDSFEFDAKCKEIYVSNASATKLGGFMLYASLTNIPTGSMYALTGSGITADE